MSVHQTTHTLELELCAFAVACLKARGSDRLDDALVALVVGAFDGNGTRDRVPWALHGPWTMEHVHVELPGALVAAIEEQVGGGSVEAWLRELVHTWAMDDVPGAGDTSGASTIRLCVSALDLMSLRQRICNGVFLGHAHAVDEAARHWLGHRARADRARALTLYLDGSHHSGVLTVAVDVELTSRIVEIAHDDRGHVVDAVYWGLTHMLGHIS